MRELDGLMSVEPSVRAEYLSKVTRGSTPKFKVTQPGDPKKMLALKATLPNIAVALKITHANDLFDANALVLNVKQTYEDLFDIEMGLCGGG